MTHSIKKIAVFCGAHLGRLDIYSHVAKELGMALARNNIELIYGGAKVGIMGVIANQMLSMGGRVTGVIPESLVAKEVAHLGLTKQHIVSSMHERKLLIAELSDAFVMLPGGMGSLDEFFELVTMAQLGYHQKPCGILDVANYFFHLIQFIEHCVDEGFVREFHRNMIIVEQNATLLLNKFNHYHPPEDRWSVSPLAEISDI